MPSTCNRRSITNSSKASRAEGGAAQHIPHPAVIVRGTGMSLPGSYTNTLCS